MNDNPLQLAKRETQQSFASKTVWIALLAAGVILGIAGPFQTEQFLPLIPRVLYWVALSCGFYFLGSFVGTYFHRLLGRAGAGELLAAVVAGAVAGLAIFAALIAINIVLFDINADSVKQFWPLGLNVVGISTVITVAIVQIKRHMASGRPEAADSRPEAKPAPILRRLPMEKRGLWTETSDELAAEVRNLVDAGDCLLAKGSLSMGLSKVVDAVRKLGHPAPQSTNEDA